MIHQYNNTSLFFIVMYILGALEIFLTWMDGHDFVPFLLHEHMKSDKTTFKIQGSNCNVCFSTAVSFDSQKPSFIQTPNHGL